MIWINKSLKRRVANLENIVFCLELESKHNNKMLISLVEKLRMVGIGMRKIEVAEEDIKELENYLEKVHDIRYDKDTDSLMYKYKESK